MTHRIPFIDIARGIAINLVIIGHCISTPENPINRFILSFHMPLFFIISGMLMPSIKPQVSFSKFLFDKAKRLLLPQILLGVLFYLYGGVKGFTHTHTFEMFMPLHLYEGIMNAWFLLVMFVVTILAFIYRNFSLCSNIIIRQVLFNALILIMALWVQYTPGHFCGSFAYINLVPMAWLFYVTGFYFKYFLCAQTTNYSEIISFLVILITYVGAQINTPVRMFASEYGILPIFIATSLLASFAIIKLSQRIEFYILKWSGYASIALYVFQFPVSMISFDISTSLLLHYGINNEPLRIALTIILALPGTYIITCLMFRTKIMRYVFGVNY